MSGSEREGGNPNGMLLLRNMPNSRQRTLLLNRLVELNEAFKQENSKDAAIAIMDMLQCYDVASSVRLTNAEKKEAATIYVTELRGVPIWAIQTACMRIRMGTAGGISAQYKPTPIQVRQFAEGLIEPLREERGKLSLILFAKEYRSPPNPETQKEMKEKLTDLAEKLKRGEWRKAGSLSDQLDEQDRQRHEAYVRRADAANKRAVAREWEAAGEKPVMAGEIMISRSLVKSVEEGNARRAAIPPEPEE